MLIKALTIASIAFFATSRGAREWDGLTSYWNTVASNGFYTLPQLLTDAQSEGWTELEGADPPDGYVVYCFNGDPSYGLYFLTDTGVVGGIQISIAVVDVAGKGIPIDYENHIGIYKKTYNGTDWYTSSAFFRLDGDDDDGPRIWIKDQEGTHNISTDPEIVLQETPYLEKRCVRMMGTHFNRVNSTLDCAYIYPWFLLKIDDKICGLGFQAIATPTRRPKRVWWEDFEASGVRYAIPDAPDCMTQYVITYGLASSHTWFLKDPYNITCT